MCSLSVEKLREATPMFLMVDYVREMTVKKSCVASMDHLSICFSFFFFFGITGTKLCSL